MSLGESIHAARKAAGLSQEALGEKLGVVSQTVSKWERGENAPDAALLPLLADALGVSLDQLFDRTPTDAEMEARLLAWLRPKTEDERSESLLRILRLRLELDLGILDGTVVWPNMPADIRYTSLGERTISLCARDPENPAAFIFQKPKAGWTSLFRDPEETRLIWEALGDAETREVALRILASPRLCLRQEALEGTLGMKEPLETVPRLVRLGLMNVHTYPVDGENTMLYWTVPDPRILSILLMARLLWLPFQKAMYVVGGGWANRPPLAEETASNETMPQWMIR